MRKSTRIVKRILALFLSVLMSINTLGAVVSDNDGSAFITKAEFDSLKNDFQSQINRYNESIDNKIDGAIAAYLEGVAYQQKSNLQNLIAKDYGYIEMFNKDNPLPIENGEINGDFTVYMQAMGMSTNDQTIGGGLVRTNYKTKTPVYKNRSWAKRINDKFYNLCVFNGNLNLTYQIVGNWADLPRFLGYNNSIMAVSMLQGNPNWPDDLWNRHVNCAWQNTGICYVINSENWMDNYNEIGVDGPQEYEFAYDEVNKKWNVDLVYKVLNSVDWEGKASKLADQSGRINSCFNVVAHCPTLTSGNMNVCWAPDAGVTRSQDVSWVKKDESTKTTLVGITPYTYETAINVWPLLSYDVVPTQFAKYTVKPASINLKRTHMRRMWSKTSGWKSYDTYWYYFQNDYSQADNQPATVKALRVCGCEAAAAEWTSMTYLLGNDFDDKNKLLFLDDEILMNEPNDKLKNYLANYNLSAGIPMWHIENDGKLEVTLPFEDTTKEYNCWFTNGPMMIDPVSNIATNTYKYDRTENADKSVTLKSSDKVTFQVSKDDIVYVSWTEKNKLGGGKIPNPINAVFILD